MLTSKEREIAIQAIAARATGNCAEAAVQILKGVAALEGPDDPVVVWPSDWNVFTAHGMSFEQKAAWHERQAAEIRTSIKETEDYWTSRGVQRVQYRECSDTQSHAAASLAPAAAVGKQSGLDAEEVEAAPHSEQELDQGASDASR